MKDDFPIGQDGILGRDYLKRERAVISYNYNALIISWDVTHPLPFIDPHSGQSIGDVSVTEGAERIEKLNAADLGDDSPESSARAMYTIPRRNRQVVKINVINKYQLGGCAPLRTALCSPRQPPLNTSFLHNTHDRNTQENHC